MLKCLNCVGLAAAAVLAACTVPPEPDMADAVAPPAYDDPEALQAALAGLEESSTAHYACGQGNADAMAVRFLGQDTVAEITMPALAEAPILMACMSTRVGPECSSGDMMARFDIVHDKAMLWETNTDLEIACTPAVPVSSE